jgi:hypothetical protein
LRQPRQHRHWLVKYHNVIESDCALLALLLLAHYFLSPSSTSGWRNHFLTTPIALGFHRYRSTSFAARAVVFQFFSSLPLSSPVAYFVIATISFIAADIQVGIA